MNRHYLKINALLFYLLIFTLTESLALRVATYNVKNYLSTDRMVDGKWEKNYPKPESEKTALRKITLTVNPDVLLIQEIGSKEHIEELISDLKTEGLTYTHFTINQGEDNVRHVACLSKIPFHKIEHHRQVPITYLGEKSIVKRGLLQITFKNEATIWTLFGLHLKSPRTENKKDPKGAKRRLAEAQAIRDIIKTKFANTPNPLFLIAGDFNDKPTSATLRRFLKINKRKFTEQIKAVDSRNEFWTQLYQKDSIYFPADYILASPNFLPYVKNQKAFIADGPFSLIASDHRMVYIDLDFSSSNLIYKKTP